MAGVRQKKGGDEPAHLRVGRRGEDAALGYLAAKGFRLLDRNWRPAGRAAGLELDLVGRMGGELLFVEVKSRRAASRGPVLAGKSFETDMGDPLASFTPAKRRNMARVAGRYLKAMDAWDEPCRFDLVCVTFFPDDTVRVEHHAHVITFDESLGGGNAAWQPW